MQCTALSVLQVLHAWAGTQAYPGRGKVQVRTGVLSRPKRSRDNDRPSTTEAKPHQGSVHAWDASAEVPFSGQVRCVPRACWARPAVGRWRQVRQALAGGRAGCRAQVPLMRSVYGAVRYLARNGRSTLTLLRALSATAGCLWSVRDGPNMGYDGQ